METIKKEDLIKNFKNRAEIEKTRQYTAIMIKSRNDNYYFTTIPSKENRFKDLIIYNPNTKKVDLYDFKNYLNNLLFPAIINDTDLTTIKKYLTHLRGDYRLLKQHIKGIKKDDIIERQIKEEQSLKERLKLHYKIVGGSNE